MTSLLVLIGSLNGCAVKVPPFPSAPLPADAFAIPTGIFQSTVQAEGFVFDTRLRCMNAHRCELSFTTQAPKGGGIVNDSVSVTPQGSTQTDSVQFALNHAVQHRNVQITHLAQAAIHQKMLPWLSLDPPPRIDHCWDVSRVAASGDDWVCTFAQDAPDPSQQQPQQPLFLFRTLKTPCTETASASASTDAAFCRYSILPLLRLYSSSPR